MMRVIFVTLAVGLLVGGAWYCGRAVEHVVVASTRAAVLEKEVAAITDGIRTLQESLPQIQAWRTLLAQSQPLQTERMRRYPIQVSRQVRWEEAAALILIVSNSHPRPGGYRFQPTLLRVQQMDPGEDNATEMYDLFLSGQFVDMDLP